MFSKLINRHFYLHEIILCPFVILMVITYKVFGLQFTYFPAFFYWSALIILSSVLIAIVAFCFTKSFELLFDYNYSKYIFESHRLKVFIRLMVSMALVLLVYENLQFSIETISPVNQDAALLFYDKLLFGSNHITVFLQRFITSARTEWFSFAYLSFFFYIPVLAIAFYLKDRSKDFELLTLTITMVLFFGYILYTFFPAVGPGVYLSREYTYSLSGDLTAKFTEDLVNSYGYPRGTFPSLHVACSTVYLYFSFKHSKLLFCTFLPVILSLWFSTLYLRQHYIIDIFAGFFLAIICIYAAPIFNEKWNQGI